MVRSESVLRQEPQMNTSYSPKDFAAWQVAQAVLANASRLSEVEELRKTVKEFATALSYLQKG